MRELGLAVSLLLCLTITGCSSGPSQISRSIDDWDNHMYVRSPWANSILHVIPVIPLAKSVGGWVDVLFLNPMAFWTDDAWDNKGIGFWHKNPEHAVEVVKNVFLDDGTILGKVPAPKN